MILDELIQRSLTTQTKTNFSWQTTILISRVTVLYDPHNEFTCKRDKC